MTVLFLQIRGDPTGVRTAVHHQEQAGEEEQNVRGESVVRGELIPRVSKSEEIPVIVPSWVLKSVPVLFAFEC